MKIYDITDEMAFSGVTPSTLNALAVCRIFLNRFAGTPGQGPQDTPGRNCQLPINRANRDSLNFST